MGIRYDDKSKSYLVRIRRRGVTVARTFKRKSDAETFHAKKLQEIRDQADFGKKERRTLAAGITKFLVEEVAKQKSAEKTKSNILALTPHITGLYIDQIDEAARRVKAATRQSRSPLGWKAGATPKPLKPATYNRRLAILRRVANLAYTEWHWLDRPIAVRLLPEHNKRHEYMESEEIRKLSNAARYPVNHWVVGASYTGVRRSNMLEMDNSNLRGDNVFLGMTKNGKPILIPVNTEVKRHIKEWIKAPKPDPRTLHKYFKAAAKVIGRPNLTPHDMRHTTASLILNAGYGLEDVAEVLNCTIANAQRYAHLSLENKRKVLKKIGPSGKIGIKSEVKKKRVTSRKA